MTRNDLPSILIEILKYYGGSADMMSVFKRFWKEYGKQLDEDEDLFYTWNYDIRWAATKLRKSGIMKNTSTKENTYGENVSSKGIWALEQI